MPSCRLTDRLFRYSHADEAHGQQATPACNTAMRYIVLDRSTCSRVFLYASALPCWRFRFLLGIDEFTPPATVGDRPARPTAVCTRSPWLLAPRGPHSLFHRTTSISAFFVYTHTLLGNPGFPASCHLGAAHILRMLDCSYWWIGMTICTR